MSRDERKVRVDRIVKLNSNRDQMANHSPPGPKRRNTAVFEVKLTTPLGPIKGHVSIDTGPMRLVDLVPTAYELTNILVKLAVQREEKAGRRISCRPQCGVCCRQMVPLSPPEAFYLANLIDSLEFHKRNALLESFGAIRDRLIRHGMINKLMSPEYSDDPVLAIAKQYFQAQMACPFLVDESCSIHPHRPVACREYNVTSPAAWCADPYSYEIAKVRMVIPLSAPLARLTAQLTGSTPRLIPLTLVPTWVAENADLREQAWPGFDLFQQFMAEVGKSPRTSTP
jgi:Fe-S-cluster containining protein